MSFNKTLNTVRTYKNYGIVLEGNTQDPVFVKGWLRSNPNVFSKGNSCYIDYSNCYDTSDVTYLKRTFGKLPAGSTFVFQDTLYQDLETNSGFTLGGTLSFQYTLNNGKIIVSKIISGMSPKNSYDFFEGNNFKNTPQHRFFNYTGFTANFLLNTLPLTSPTSFEKMGILGSELGFEEYIDFSGATGVNYGRIKVGGTTTLLDDQEVMYLTEGATSQSMLDTPTTIKHYIRGSSNVDEIQQPEDIVGIYRIHDESNKLVDCYENQNFYQTYLRKQVLGATQSGYWVQCETCPDDIYGTNVSSDGMQSNLLFDNNVFLFINQIVRNNTGNLLPTTSYGVFTQRLLSGTAQSASRLSFSVSVGLKIDLSHASLQGWTFQVFTDPTYTMPLANSISVSGKPGYDQAYVLLKNSLDIPRTLYCRLSGIQTINMVFNI